jgi:hypothetical protein
LKANLLHENITRLPQDNNAINTWSSFSTFMEEIGNYEQAEKISRISLALCERLGSTTEVNNNNNIIVLLYYNIIEII